MPGKSFDIVHPTKGKGHRLRYACIEGPEVAVYCRGRLKESNVIQLPYYWKDLVHEDSITVQLQPIGSNQNLVIQEFNNEFIVIAEDSTNTDLITDLSTIDCFYHVYGERKILINLKLNIKVQDVDKDNHKFINKLRQNL